MTETSVFIFSLIIFSFSNELLDSFSIFVAKFGVLFNKSLFLSVNSPSLFCVDFLIDLVESVADKRGDGLRKAVRRAVFGECEVRRRIELEPDEY